MNQKCYCLNQLLRKRVTAQLKTVIKIWAAKSQPDSSKQERKSLAQYCVYPHPRNAVANFQHNIAPADILPPHPTLIAFLIAVKKTRSLSCNKTVRSCFFFLWRFDPISGHGLPLRGFAITSLDTPHSVWLLWTSDHPEAENYIWQHTTLTRNKPPCSLRHSNPKHQQASGCRPTP